MTEIYLEDEKKTVLLSVNPILKPGEKAELNSVYLLGANLLEGRTKQTYWKSTEEMKKYIVEKKSVKDLSVKSL